MDAFILALHAHSSFCYCCFFFNYTATTEIYTLSLHDALPIYEFLTKKWSPPEIQECDLWQGNICGVRCMSLDRKSTRLNSDLVCRLLLEKKNARQKKRAPDATRSRAERRDASTTACRPQSSLA